MFLRKNCDYSYVHGGAFYALFIRAKNPHKVNLVGGYIQTYSIQKKLSS